MSDDEAPAAEAQEAPSPDGGAAPAKRRGAVLSAKKLAAHQARYDKRGVVYLSRVPPFMKPAKLRHLLELHGEVLRLYLAAEGARSGGGGRARRRASCARRRVLLRGAG